MRRKRGELVEYLGVIYLVLERNDSCRLPPNNPTQYQPLESETIDFGQPKDFDGGDEIDVTKIAIHDTSTGKTYKSPEDMKTIHTWKGKVSDVKLETGRTWSKDEIKADYQKILNNCKFPTPPNVYQVTLDDLDERMEALEKYLKIEPVSYTHLTPPTILRV